MPDIASCLRQSYRVTLVAAVFCMAAAQAQVFSPPNDVSQNLASDSSYPSLVVDAAGNINVAWIDSASGVNFTRPTNGGQSFLPPIAIAGSVGARFQPQMVVDSTGTIVEIAWSKPSSAANAPLGTFDVFVSRSIDGGLTFPPTNTKQVSSDPVILVGAPRLALDGAGVDVVWGNTETWINQSSDGLNFPNPPTKLSLPNTPQDSGGPRIAVDRNGNIFVAWTDRLAEIQNRPGNYCTDATAAPHARGTTPVFTNMFGGNFYVNETLSGSTPSSANTRNLSNSNTDWKGSNPSYPNGYFGCSYDSLQLFFDQNNNLHLLWADDAPLQDLLTSTAIPPASGNGMPTFSFPIATDGNEGASWPTGAADNAGSIYVAYAAGSKAPAGTEGIYFDRSDNDGLSFFFPEPRVISAPGAISPAYPQIALDSHGNVNIVWEQADQPITATSTNTFHLFFAHSDDRGDTFPTIRQVAPVASSLCIPPNTSGTAPTTPDTTTCGTVQMGVGADSNGDIIWVNNPGSGARASIDFASANVAAQPTADFAISVSPTTQRGYAGQTVTYTVTAQATGNFAGPITLGCNDFRAVTGTDGATISREDYSCTSSGSLTAGNSATINLLIPGNLPQGQYPFAINGTSGGITHRVMVTVDDVGSAGSVQPGSATLAVGASANFTVNINRNAFTGTVSFGCAGQPAWIQCSFRPASIDPAASASSVLTVTVGSAPTSSLLRYPPSVRSLPPLVNGVVGGTTFAILCLMVLAMIALGRQRQLKAMLLPRGLALVALTLLAVGLISCGGGTAPPSAPIANNTASGTGSSVASGGSGGGGTGGGSGSNVATTTFAVRAQSSSGATNLGSISITTQ
jgi:hypothetical protein